MTLLAKRREGVAPSAMELQELRVLFDQCSTDPDADDAVCYHGVAALLAEADGDRGRAIQHRNIEIEKIVWLHEEEKRNPTQGFQTQDYEALDLELRRAIVGELQRNL